MSEEGAAKLRLKPRKAPPTCSREPSPGREHPRRRQMNWIELFRKIISNFKQQYGNGQAYMGTNAIAIVSANTSMISPQQVPSSVFEKKKQTLTDRCSWFEKEDLNECEKTWILLLKDTSRDSQCTNWQTVPSFPEFFGKSSEEESLREQEVFTVGMKDFQWVSFPSFCKEKCLNPKDLSSYHLTQSHINHLHQGQGRADKLESLPSTAEKTCCVTTTDSAKNMVGEDTKGISKLDVSPKSCKPTQHRSSTHHLALSQSSAKTFSFQQHCGGTVQNRENRKENDRKELQLQTHQGSISFGEARYVPAEKKPLVSVPGNESCKENMENQSEGSSTLDSCPMCLVHFSGTLSQLDIDGHLARCLSESADDVMW